MSWSGKRKAGYALAVIGALILVVWAVFYFFFSEPATCFDNKKNQDEIGVDCGGNICALRCESEIKPIVSLWDPRIFKIADGVYTSVVYVVNPNNTAAATGVPYTLKVYDSVDSNVLLREIVNIIDIYPQKAFPIIETGIQTGKRIPGRVVISFDEKAVPWVKASPRPEDVVAKGAQIETTEKSSSVNGTVQNISAHVVSDIDVVAIVFDKNDNALGASRTFIDSLKPNESQPVYFTWPTSFASSTAKVVLYPRVLGQNK